MLLQRVMFLKMLLLYWCFSAIFQKQYQRAFNPFHGFYVPFQQVICTIKIHACFEKIRQMKDIDFRPNSLC